MTTFQVVTILKNTTKLVTDVPFPALTICGSGIHMNNVEKKLTKDFDTWRIGNDRNETNEEAAKKDMEEFMHTRFQIKPSKSEPEELVSQQVRRNRIDSGHGKALYGSIKRTPESALS